MAVALDELVAHANSYLAIDSIKDYCPNGLQVQGRARVQKIVSGVTASLALLQAALQADADLVLVHHGYFWKNEPPSVVGMKQRRLQLLLGHDLNLAAYHLPLDVHLQVGNNVQLAVRLGIEVEGSLDPADRSCPVVLGRLPEPMPARAFAERVEQVLERSPLLVDGPRPVQRIGWCTGGGQGYIDQAIAAGVDLYLTGEASEPTYHSAVENKVAFIAAGHHATERYGVQALGEYLAGHFGLEHQFIDINNPI